MRGGEDEGGWAIVEGKYGASCPSSGDQASVQSTVSGFTNCLSGELATGTPGSCSVGGGLPETGQTQCDQGAGTLGACPGSPAGQDGSLQPGVERTGSLTDNGGGTVSDSATGLMWEKLDDNNSDPLHDFSTTFTWYDAFKKIQVLNGDNTGCIGAGSPAACCSGAGTGTCTAFLGHTDWRLPARLELESILNLGAVGPSAYTQFSSSCAGGCTTTGTPCSCTQSGYYWSSTTYQSDPASAWVVRFVDGLVTAGGKSVDYYVRAVRGGS